MLIHGLPHPLPSRALAVGFLIAHAACSSSETDSLPAALRADLQSSLADAVDQQLTPGATLYVSSGDGETWSTSAGIGDIGQGAAMTTDDRFRAGSIIKTLVASAILQEVEGGTLHLDDVLTERLPARVTDRIEHAASIDVGMLLGHHSGIPEWDTSEVDQSLATHPDHIWTLDEILDSAQAQSALFLPGERFSYSNTNYILLGEILAGVEGRSWREVIREKVIARAGLRDTSVPDVGDLSCPEPCAHGYLALEGELLDLTRIDPSMAGASGGHALLTSAADLDRLLHALRAGELFDRPETLGTMFAFQPAPDPEMYMTAYGLGVMQLEVEGRVVVGHLGGAPGYQSFMLYAPGTDRYVSGFINVMGDLGAVLLPILARVTLP